MSTRRASKALAAVVGMVATMAGGSVAVADKAVEPQFEIVVSRLADGTPPFTSLSSETDPGAPPPPGQNPSPHTPGYDSGRNNYVVRTHDGAVFNVAVDINELPATNVIVELKIVTSSPADSVNWKPNEDGGFNGCGPGSNISADGQTFSCYLGDAAEGTHVEFQPAAVVDAGADNDIFNIVGTIRADNSNQAPSSTLEDWLTISEGPAGDFTKHGPSVYSLGDGAYADRLVRYPLTLSDLYDPAIRRRGTGQLDPSVDIVMYDHGWDLPEGARLARQAEMDQLGVAGKPCGGWPQDDGMLAPTAGTWTCKESSPNGYPVTEIKVTGWDTERIPETDIVLAGQIVFFFPGASIKDDIEDDPDANSTRYVNGVSGDPVDADLSVLQDKTGNQINNTITPIDVPGGPPPESVVANNYADITFSGPGPTPGGTIPVSTATYHNAAIVNGVELVQQRDLILLDGRTARGPAHNAFYNASEIPNEWAGDAQGGRGAPTSIQFYMGAGSPDPVNIPMHGCAVWSPNQIWLEGFPAGATIPLNEHPGQKGLPPVAPTGTLEWSQVGFPVSPPARRGVYETAADVDAATAAMFDVIIEYSYDESAYSAKVGYNSVECNNDPGRTWVASTDIDGLQANFPAYGADGTVVADAYNINMMRVRVEGKFPWQGRRLDPNAIINSDPWMTPDISVMVLMNGIANPSRDVNPDGAELYVHSSRAFGDWNPADAAAPPTTTSCYPLITERALWVDSLLDSEDPGEKTWCNLPYAPENERMTPTMMCPGEDNCLLTDTFLDPGGFSARWRNANITEVLDSDHDKLTIYPITPAVTKTNDTSPFDIKGEGDLVTYRLVPKAIGSPTEALTNFRVIDELPDYYEFVSVSQPAAPGASCDIDRSAGPQGTIVCQYSEPDWQVNTDDDLPFALPGQWTDPEGVLVTVKVVNPPAEVDTYARLINTASAVSDGYGFLDAAGTGFEAYQPETQSFDDEAASYVPLGDIRGRISKDVVGSLGACIEYPGPQAPSADWKERCALTDLDEDPSNTTPDTEGNLSFVVNYTNESDVRIRNIRIIDVLPYNGDGETGNDASNSPTDGADPPTVGDLRTPGSDFSGSLELVGVAAMEGPADWPAGDQVMITNADPEGISRDPALIGQDGSTWCVVDPTSGTVGTTPTIGAGTCPSSLNDATAVWLSYPGLDGGESFKIGLQMDSEGASCDSYWTNTFGARARDLSLPIRSNDVLAMVGCTYSLGNQVWRDDNNNGVIDDGEPKIPDVEVLLFTDLDGDGVADDTNGDGELNVDDAVATDITDENGLYLFDGLAAGDYLVGIAPTNWGDGKPLDGLLSSTFTEADPNADIDNNDDGPNNDYQLMLSGVVTLSDTEPLNEDPDNDDNADNRSNLTVDFGFYQAIFDLAIRKTSPTVALGEVPVIKPGDSYTWKIEVFNQGNVIGDDIGVIDYIPAGWTLDDPDWVAGDDNTATFQLDGPLAVGESVMLEITLASDPKADVRQVDENFVEIATQTPVNPDGSIINGIDGKPIPDIDSVPDTTNGNDKLIDNEIDKTPETGDEDDHDIELIGYEAVTPPTTTVVTTVVTTTTVTRNVRTGANVEGPIISGFGLLGIGLLLVSFRRRTVPVGG